MIRRWLQKITIKLLGDEVMMAIFLAQRIVLGKLEFNEVPEVLKPAAYEHLVDSGLGFLVGDYTPPVNK